ncbi:SDR family oxidoreductase, partial [Bacillus cereus]
SSSRVSENQGLYALSKSCIDVMTKYLAIELCNQNINVNAIAPGLIKTNMSKNVWTDKALLESIVNNIPDKRIGIPKDISNIVMFLTSSKAKWIKGQTIIADGGASLTH